MKTNLSQSKKRIEDTFRPSGETVRNYICICKECGKEFPASHTMIRDHLATFCKECKKERRNEKKNKYYGTRIYSIWRSMLNRCYWKKHKHYNNYGGRGIAVCDEWLGRCGYINFYKWAKENGYSLNLTIDRIDSSGNYEPSNCRWATMKQQGRNKRNNRLIMYKGSEITIAEASERLDIPYSYIYYRIIKGKSLDEIIEMYKLSKIS